jgi:hypothetical protein
MKQEEKVDVIIRYLAKKSEGIKNLRQHVARHISFSEDFQQFVFEPPRNKLFSGANVVIISCFVSFAVKYTVGDFCVFCFKEVTNEADESIMYMNDNPLLSKFYVKKDTDEQNIRPNLLSYESKEEICKAIDELWDRFILLTEIIRSV